MKKFIFMMLMMLSVAFSANAQTDYQKANFLDNTYVGVHGGISSPLDFNSVTPFNTNAGVKIGKNWTPVVGTNIEGGAIFGDNHFVDSKTFVKASYVGLNGTLNLMNLLNDYNPDKKFETTVEAGFGWLHCYGIQNAVSDYSNDLGAKTGVIFSYNLGKKNAWQVYAEPSVYWNLTRNHTDHKVQFNKNFAQVSVQVGVVYKFKTSNGTHGFKKFNISDYENRLADANTVIASLSAENKALRERPTEVREVVRSTTETVLVNDNTTVSFVKGSYELTQDAKNLLDRIPVSNTVRVIGSTSPEGTTDFNTVLAENRAKAVANYLKSRGVNVETVKGGDAGRIAVVSIVK